MQNVKICESSSFPTFEGWIKEHIEREANGITGNLDKLFIDCSKDIFNSERVIHEENGYWSSWWAGETQGNWIESVVRLASYSNDVNIHAKAKSIISNLINSQDSDGYIGIYKPGHRYKVTKRFGEFWTQSRAMRTLIVAYNETKDENLKNVLIKFSDNIINGLKTQNTESLFAIPDEDGSKGHSLMIIETLYYVYSITNDPKYKDFCVWLFEDYCNHDCLFLENDLRPSYLFNKNQPFIGHGPHTAESLRLPLILYIMTNNLNYYKIYNTALKKFRRNLAISGSLKSDEFIGIYQNLTPNSEEIINAGSIPLPSAGYEFCSTTELLIDYQYHLKLLNDLSFADKIEWLYYNSGFASKHHNGKSIQYIGCDNMYDASTTVGERYDYSPTHSDAAVCCAPNSCKISPLFFSQIYLTYKNKLIINHFAPNSYKIKIGNSSISINQTTNYPMDMQINFHIDCNNLEQEIYIRIPSWCKKVNIICPQIKKAKLLKLLNSFAIKVDTALYNKDFSIELITKPELIKNIDGTFSVSFGSLLYSLDIKYDEELYHFYDDPNFYDVNYTHKIHENWDYTLLLKNKRLVYSFNSSNGYLWEKSSTLNILMLDRYSTPNFIALKPIGSTILRRSSFPIFNDKNNYFKCENYDK